MTLAPTALDADWLGACRRAVAGLKQLLAEAPTTAERVRETGTRGSGGDRTLVLDSDAEAVMVAQLDALRAEGYRFSALSEERGEMDYGDHSVRVIIDPIDGSLNAKRGASHYALSVGVADGPTMGDMAFGFVHDFGASEQWWAWRGQGAWLNGQQARPIAARAALARRQARAAGHRVGRPAVGGGFDRTAGQQRPPAAGPGHDRRDRCAWSRRRDSTGWSRCSARAVSTPPPVS